MSSGGTFVDLEANVAVTSVEKPRNHSNRSGVSRWKKDELRKKDSGASRKRWRSHMRDSKRSSVCDEEVDHDDVESSAVTCANEEAWVVVTTPKPSLLRSIWMRILVYKPGRSYS
jgi:hypothetical protein